MKKNLFMSFMAVLLIVRLFILTGCNKNNNSKSGGVDLTLDFKHMNKKVYSAHLDTSSDDKVGKSDEEEPNVVSLENEKENYYLDITLDTEAKDAYDQFKKSAKENDVFKEVKFGKYDGYYSIDNDDLYGYILLDSSDSTFNVFVMFSLSLYNKDSDNNDIEKIYKSASVQNILNNISFKSE